MIAQVRSTNKQEEVKEAAVKIMLDQKATKAMIEFKGIAFPSITPPNAHDLLTSSTISIP